MESTIIVAFITALGTIINTVISKKTNKKINNIDDINQKLDFMRNESKKDMLEHTIDADKTYLINFLSDLENDVKQIDSFYHSSLNFPSNKIIVDNIV